MISDEAFEVKQNIKKITPTNNLYITQNANIIDGLKEKQTNSIPIDKNNELENKNNYNIIVEEENNEMLIEKNIELENEKDLNISICDEKNSNKSLLGSEIIEEMKLKDNILELNQCKNFDKAKFRHLIDYNYDTDEENGSIYNYEVKNEEPFLILSDVEENSDLEYLGTSKKIKNEESYYFYNLFFL